MNGLQALAARGKGGKDDPQMAQGSTLGAYMPGQQGLLSSQLNAGFGGGVPQWKGILGQAYSPMTMPASFEYSQTPMGHGGGAGKDGIGDKGKALLQPYIDMGSYGALSGHPHLVDGYNSLSDQQRNWILSQWQASQSSDLFNHGGR
jgi:hypothetical protein